MLDGYTKGGPPTKKMLPVESDVPELLVLKWAMEKNGSIKAQAVCDLALIAFYYLSRIGGYSVKEKQNGSKHTVKFKLDDVTSFKKNRWGNLVCLLKKAPYSLLVTADSATLKLDNQKNGWKGVCVHQEVNGEAVNCPIRALALRVIQLRDNGASRGRHFCQNSMSMGNGGR
jgi:hypothetical protein